MSKFRTRIRDIGHAPGGMGFSAIARQERQRRSYSPDEIRSGPAERRAIEADCERLIKHYVNLNDAQDWPAVAALYERGKALSAATYGELAGRVGAPARADRVEPRSVAALVRPGDRQVPRARHGDEPADVQPLRHAADAQFPERDVRGGGQPVAGAARRERHTHGPRERRR